MNKVEFGQWWQHAVAAFPTLHRLFPASSHESRERARLWEATLAEIPLDKCKEAIDEMLAGRFETPKYDWSELPAMVLRYCREKANSELASTRQAYYDGPTVRCPICQDSRSGMVSVWNPRFVNECDAEILKCTYLAEVNDVFREWRQRDERNRYQTHVVVCTCDSPAAKAQRAERRLSTFDAKKHCTSPTVAGLHEFLRDTSRYEWSADAY